jgi:gas vesicle protein GvpL/GvpF
VLYLYAVTESPTPPELLGLRGSPLRTVGEAGLFAIVSEHEELRIQPTEDDLWAHDGVVEALMDEASVLPVRLGSLMADDAGVLAFLRERRHEFELALERVRGAVELGVRAAMAPEDAVEPEPEDAAGAAGPGTEYMHARLRRERRGTEASSRIHQPLASLARASTFRVSARERPLLHAAYLVDRERVEDFMARVDELDTQSEALIVCTGPWPPYSFSSEESQR